ncbi:DMT family transporter [Inquilinus sp.]|jgi:drug/metabolite transporter (DMT)-like permease|uniref:DMT family transporter n=1 Tax=Inquilinus sp. TaxID=1932117 RepID=UPI0037845B99
MTAALYLLVVLIWGTTWIAIHYQIGPVPVELAILYRFALAAAVMALLLLATRRREALRPRDHLVCLGQGLAMFSGNFLLIYHASAYVPSGLVAVAFSTGSVWTALFSRVALGQPLKPRVLAGGAVALAGLWLLFGIDPAQLDWQMLYGLGLALAGTMGFGAGNVFAVMHRRRGLTPWTTTAWGMLYGTLILAAVVLAEGTPWRFDPSPAYVGALLYLAIPGSVIAFLAYLTLVGRIGADKAAYSTVLFPLVALNASALLEGYVWTATAAAGVALVLLGNVLVFARLPGRRRNGAAPVGA